ncbi:MAG TPA: PIN domain-containing protein [Chloroflexota bacterium]|nr:PIN domain-containing protein [Chloroflexota bacterium]
MRLYLYFRIAGAIILAAVGWALSAPLWTAWNLYAPLWHTEVNAYRLIPTALGLIVGAVITPHVTIEPFVAGRRILRRTPASDLAAGLVGLILAGIITVIVNGPLSLLPGYLGRLLPIAVFLLLAWVFVELSIARKDELLALTTRRRARESRAERREAARALEEAAPARPSIVMDTSAIIDGRIADISQTGFIFGELVIPRFVLQELQHIADSSDALRRNRGRRGLDMLSRLQKESQVPISIRDIEADGASDVDGKLVIVAKKLQGPILTNDFNLNRVAELQGVKVLNINELANAVKPVVLPGEEMRVEIIQEGKEVGQGVGYLDDGTMIVVENGRRHMHSNVEIVVTRVLQTVAGRMIFAHPKNGSGPIR